jgi:hypothetical protein
MTDDESGRLDTQPCKLLGRMSSQLCRCLNHSRNLDNLVGSLRASKIPENVFQGVIGEISMYTHDGGRWYGFRPTESIIQAFSKTVASVRR